MLVDVFIGASLALMSQTKYRFLGPIGVGELLFASVVVFVFVTNIRRCIMNNGQNAVCISIAKYLLLILTPVTFINLVAFDPIDFGGVDFLERGRELVAYANCGLMLVVLGLPERNLKLIGQSFILVLLPVLLYQSLFGGQEAWYSGVRFSGGANNPNQTGLYLLCAATILPFTINRFLVLPILAGIAYLGYTTKSDALIISGAVFVAAFIAIHTLPKRNFYIAVFSGFFGIVLLLILDTSEALEFLTSKWDKADEGGVRLSLYLNGIEAWLSSPSSIVFGNGAGFFSGMDGPFEGSECHNTPIEILTIGGVIGLYVLFFPFVRLFYVAYIMDSRSVFAFYSGLAVFCLFHFVARHPCFWFCFYLGLVKIQGGPINGISVKEKSLAGEQNSKKIQQTVRPYCIGQLVS